MRVAQSAMNGSRPSAVPDRYLPAAAAFIALVVGLSAGWNRDFGFFVYGLLAVPLIVAASVALLTGTLLARTTSRRRASALSLAIVATIGPLAYATANRYRDEIRFALWSPAHAALLDRFAHRDGVIADWDEWGFAGLENAQYLVSIRARPIASVADAQGWARARGSPCDVATIERLRANVYLLTTMNCTLGSTAEPQSPFRRA